MGDDRDVTAFRYILEALVAVVLVGTFFIYGYSGNALYSNPGNAHGPAPEPAGIAKLGAAR
jgi:hypothetical protein